MALLGIHLTMLVGPVVPVPLAATLAENVEMVSVRHTDEGPSVAQLTLRVGKGGVTGIANDLLLKTQVRLGARLQILVTTGILPQVLFDGFLTAREWSPGSAPGSSLFTATAEDPTYKMDLVDQAAEHPAQPDIAIVAKIIASYGHVPLVIPPPAFDVPIPIERVPSQQGSDLAYLRQLAARYGYVFYLIPGPAPGLITGYWGPPVRPGLPQSALTVDMGGQTNVISFSATVQNTRATLVQGEVLDRQTGQTIPVFTATSSRPPLGLAPVLLQDPTSLRFQRLREPGLNIVQAFSRAQAITDASTDDAVTASGSLNTAQYGGLLQNRALVGVRGAGFDFDGYWRVTSVTHAIRKGSYHQDFTLKRGELGALLPTVIP